MVVPPAPSSAPAAVPVSRYRRRPRGSSPPAINAEFEIDPVANAGVPFAFDEVVRGRRHRHALGAGECEECRDVRLLANLAKKSTLTNTLTYGSGTQLWDRYRPGSRLLDGARRRHPHRRLHSSRPSAIRRVSEMAVHRLRVLPLRQA